MKDTQETVHRFKVIGDIIYLAYENSNRIDSFDPESDNARLKIASWNLILEKIPTKNLPDLYKYTEGHKSHSGMVTPADMVKAWPQYYAQVVRYQEADESKLLPERVALEKFESKVNLPVQKVIFKHISAHYKQWQALYQGAKYYFDRGEITEEDIYSGRWKGSTFNPDADICSCMCEKFPAWIFAHIETGEIICILCLAKKLGFKWDKINNTLIDNSI